VVVPVRSLADRTEPVMPREDETRHFLRVRRGRVRVGGAVRVGVVRVGVGVRVGELRFEFAVARGLGVDELLEVAVSMC
jgi:hypothetical protein